jgi:hypothetical protein
MEDTATVRRRQLTALLLGWVVQEMDMRVRHFP